jgi:20S proteasome subunit beta 7
MSTTSALAVKYRDGVLLATDTLVSYAGMAKFPNVQRIKTVRENTALAATGDYADFQYIAQQVDDLLLQDTLYEDYCTLGPAEVHSWLSRMMYNRRNKFDPLLATVLVVGYNHGAPFCGYVDSVGTSFEAPDCAATGMGAYIGLPLLRKRCADHPDMSREQAIGVIEEALRLMFYRDCKALNKVQIADVTAAGITVSAPAVLDTEWAEKTLDPVANTLVHLPN